jgi:hypothetical protein
MPAFEIMKMKKNSICHIHMETLNSIPKTALQKLCRSCSSSRRLYEYEQNTTGKIQRTIKSNDFLEEGGANSLSLPDTISPLW